MSGDAEIDNAEMKILLPPQNRTTIKIQLYQILSTRRRRFVRERQIFVSQLLNKWCDLDVTDVVRNWIGGDRNLGIELECKGCNGTLEPLQASISALIKVRMTAEKIGLFVASGAALWWQFCQQRHLLSVMLHQQ